jgi:tellurite resistance protein
MALPAAFFGMILGLVGLGNGWRIAATVRQVPPWIGEAVMFTAAVVWAILMVLYACK